MKVERNPETRGAAQAGASGAEPAQPRERSFSDVLKRRHSEGGAGEGCAFEDPRAPSGGLRNRRAPGTEIDDSAASLAPFNVPPSVLLAPAPIVRPTLERSGALDAAQAIAQKIVDSVRVESTGVGRVELVVETRADVLGGVEIRIRFEHGHVHASFATAQPEARAVLEAQLGCLREALTQRGLNVAGLAVTDARRGSFDDESGARHDDAPNHRDEKKKRDG